MQMGLFKKGRLLNGLFADGEKCVDRGKKV
jgi:hypothetical protein